MVSCFTKVFLVVLLLAGGNFSCLYVLKFIAISVVHGRGSVNQGALEPSETPEQIDAVRAEAEVPPAMSAETGGSESVRNPEEELLRLDASHEYNVCFCCCTSALISYPTFIEHVHDNKKRPKKF